MKPLRTKEHTLISIIFLGLLVFPVIQGISTLFLREGLITYWVSRSLKMGIVREVTTKAPPLYTPTPDTTRPFAVMIDNHPRAWPQSGINKAEYVFEVLVEGGITRLMAIFRASNVDEIGPVRSARPYFLEYAKEYDAVYAHVGGSDEALEILRSGRLTLDDADQFRYGAFFWRDRVHRKAPHNTYTSSDKLSALLKKRSWDQEADRVPPDVRSEVYPSGRPSVKIVVKASGASLPAIFEWNAETSSYDRFLNGKVAKTRSGATESPSTIVALEIPAKPGYDPLKKGLLKIETEGMGKATVFRNGVAIDGVWKKPPHGQTGIYLNTGKKIPFAFGQVWFLQYAPNRGGSLKTFTK